MTNVSKTFFLGANTPQGFCGYHQELYNGKEGWRAFLIKSGPGTGKSSFMKRVLALAIEQGWDPEVLRCSSDPDSLDGVVMHDIRTVVFDATSPHILEPKYWGTVEELVDFSSCMDGDRLHSDYATIIKLTDACGAAHAECRRYMAAASAFLDSNRRLQQTAIDTDKLMGFAGRVAHREWGKASGQGRETKRFLSAVTPKGLTTFTDTLTALCPKLYIIEDKDGSVADLLMTRWRQSALDAGLDIITCRCPVLGSIDHILIPAIGVGFTLSNPYHPASLPSYRRVHAERFMDGSILQPHRQTIAFGRKAAKELLQSAVTCAQKAKRIHDEMERFSQAAMDWDKANEIADGVLERLRKRGEEANA